MDSKDALLSETFELRPVIGLTRDLATADLEALTVNAIRLHRELVGKADQLFQGLPENYRTGATAGGAGHLEYIEVMIAMHAQMTAVNALVGVLGYIPKVSVN